MQAATQNGSLLRNYAAASAIIGSVITWLVIAIGQAREPLPAEALIAPMLGMFAVTVVVWLAMVFARNIAVVLGRASIRYYEDYQSDVPDERIERPARTFNNLMQVPTLFYVVCILMLVTKHMDAAQVTVAWTFVALRALHAAVYIGINFVPYRFAVWISSFIVLCVLWYRFALAALGS